MIYLKPAFTCIPASSPIVFSGIYCVSTGPIPASTKYHAGLPGSPEIIARWFRKTPPKIFAPDTRAGTETKEVS